MSAGDHLSPQQFVHHTDLASMYSADFDVPMSHTLDAMRAHDNAQRVQPEDRHPSYTGDHNSPGSYVAHLAADIGKNGMRSPITVRGGNVVVDGHHRALAAMRLRLDKVPVEHIP